MKLILDFGNTYQKCALIDGKQFTITSFENITLEGLQELLSDKDVDSVILSSVINFDNRIKTWLSENYFFVELTEKTPIPITNKYSTPDTLGKDRLAAAIGAYSMFKGCNVLSVDCGTAIKFDMVTAAGEYLGGAISPGLWLRFKALHTFTDKLPLVSYEFNPALIGTDTESSIKSGVINGALAEIEGIINRYRQQFDDLKTVMTGGEMIYFEKSIKSNIFAEPNLVIIGLYQILLFNEKNKVL